MEREVTESELRATREIWLTRSIREVVPVVQPNGAPPGRWQARRSRKRLARYQVDLKRQLRGLDSQPARKRLN